MIFNIQRFSTHDGSGIRTTVFFKGCPLSCPWCSNPESQSFGYDVFFDRKKCIGCMECVRLSENGEFEKGDEGITLDRRSMEDPLRFKDICPARAIQVIGEAFDMEKLLKEIEKDKAFYASSGGGVTFSGGEPFAHPCQLSALAKELKHRGITTAVETCLAVKWENIEAAVNDIDQFLVDLKHVDAEKLRSVTGLDFTQYEHNLKALEALKIPVTIRIPVIPGFNDSVGDMHMIMDHLTAYTNIKKLHLIPYHSFGMGKYRQLGREYKCRAEAMDKEELKPFSEYAESKGFATVIGG